MVRFTGVALAAGIIAAGPPALAQEIRGWRPAAISEPFADQTSSLPSAAELMAAWPAKAAQHGTEGDAIARCKADASGDLADCQVLVERPGRAGFGEALLALAPKYRLTPAPNGERPPEAPVLISASWPVPDVAPSWRVDPQPGDFATTASPAFWRLNQPGIALMNCLLGAAGTLYDCRVVFQHPEGVGLGQMALRFAPFLLYKPALLDGKPVKVGVTLPFHFGTERWRW
ncbi:MAG TPA: TonB family protein [Phenylobacterium sp.]|nr:TonB family protein [Phenylobacterium sp.]